MQACAQERERERDELIVKHMIFSLSVTFHYHIGKYYSMILFDRNTMPYDIFNGGKKSKSRAFFELRN